MRIGFSRETTMYWLFQSNPDIFRLRDALRAEALESFAITAHKRDISKGDFAILWQSGREAGCYGLAKIVSDVQEMPIPEGERPFFQELPEETMRVQLRVEYNLWNKPIVWEMLRDNPIFEDFNAGLPGTNFIATEQQYLTLEDLSKQADLMLEPEMIYQTPVHSSFPLNLILYGPPGTGKTWQTVNYAVGIIENRSPEELALEKRQTLRARFEHYLAQGQIIFVTFHASFSYEDFVEGIKPLTTASGELSYQIEDGIFKVLCKQARQCVLEVLLREQPQEQRKMQFNQLYRAFLEFLKSERFRHFEMHDGQEVYLHQIQKNGNLSLRPAIAFHTYTIEKSILRKLFQQFPLVEDLPEAHQYIDRSIRGSESELYWVTFATLKQFEELYLQQKNTTATNEDTLYETIEDMPLLPAHILNKCKRYVLIIDEINRGNTASIFGELITLLEPDKREGNREALAVMLPYSKTFFSLPPNLYILGTMNTAGRSLEALDLALRRRFAFQEVPPDPNLINQLADKPVIRGIELAKLLETINRRIEWLLDREYRIGHSWLLQVDNLEDLRAVFAQRIIPMLQEYFFDDYAKIGLVLGRDFVREKYAKPHFADFDAPHVDLFSDKRLYELVPLNELDEGAFINIYKNDASS